jgi:hypothetical protein
MAGHESSVWECMTENESSVWESMGGYGRVWRVYGCVHECVHECVHYCT